MDKRYQRDKTCKANPTKLSTIGQSSEQKNKYQKIAMEQKKFFTEQLMDWNEKSNDRKMPWKGIDNAYFIWLSEIIMQQTRVEQGWPYYEKFTTTYPTVQALADAPEDEVMKLWQGLGYYSRCRNLHAAAKFIANELDGKFPDTHADILKLKGVGPYTAAAIASFAYNLPHAVVDGNVYRVLSRFFGIETPIDSTEGKKKFASLAQELIDKKKAGIYNQAIMDFGAVQCSPAKPLCMFCPLQEKCTAHLTGKVELLPIKTKKIKKTERFFYYLVMEENEGFYMKKRTEKGIWQNLYDFPLIETKKAVDQKVLQQKIAGILKKDRYTIEKTSINKVHILTHQKINIQFVVLKVTQQPTKYWDNLLLVNDLDNYPFPKIVAEFFKKKGNAAFFDK